MMSRVKNKKVVMVTGAFDTIHLGHIAHLRQASKYGDVFVVLARDKTVKRLKGQNTLFNEKERLEMLLELKVVKKAILGDLRDPYKSILSIKPDVICLGYDQRHFVAGLKDFIKVHGLDVKVIRTHKRSPKKYKSSHIKGG